MLIPFCLASVYEPQVDGCPARIGKVETGRLGRCEPNELIRIADGDAGDGGATSARICPAHLLHGAVDWWECGY